MGTKREERELSEFLKFKKPGQLVVGQVDKFGKAGDFDTQYMVMAPVIIRDEPGGDGRLFGSVAIGLSAGLISKINPRKDTGTYLKIEFTGTVASGKGSPKKVFDVEELSEAEFAKLENRARKDMVGHGYKSDRDEPEFDPDADEDDDLPF